MQEDQRLVQLALSRRYLTQDQVDAALQEQSRRRSQGGPCELWAVLQELGYIDTRRSRELRQYLSSAQVRSLEVEGYALSQRIGRGGMGVVYGGVNSAGNEVAIKLLPAPFTDDPQCVARFEAEGRITRRLNHQHIVATHSAGLIEGQRYLLMELVKGPSLSDLIRRCGTLLENDALTLLAQMASACDYAWNHGVLHRDIKPSNILLGPMRLLREEPFCAKLCDFGLARIWRLTEQGQAYLEGRLTSNGLTMGTPEYMSPEQVTGRDLDQRSDIYNLGATLYHALVGQAMFDGTKVEILRQQRDVYPDLSALVANGFSRGLITIVARMLAKDPERRWRDWQTVLAQVRPLAPALVEAAMEDAGSRVARIDQ